jgi:hypothetical protein
MIGVSSRNATEWTHALAHPVDRLAVPNAGTIRPLQSQRRTRPRASCRSATTDRRVKRALMPGMEELNEMTIGRTDDPENPLVAPACEVASVFGAGSRTPSGPAVMLPRQQRRTHDRNRPTRQISHFFSCIPGAVPHMQHGLARFAPAAFQFDLSADMLSVDVQLVRRYAELKAAL